mmetsp:Transcript_8789/g.18989  ORF Transcript_8789/g.18989 Transcript_8789/m.18989 type:complete len:214 (+) Transcript_8789:171-812(+)
MASRRLILIDFRFAWLAPQNSVEESFAFFSLYFFLFAVSHRFPNRVAAAADRSCLFLFFALVFLFFAFVFRCWSFFDFAVFPLLPCCVVFFWVIPKGFEPSSTFLLERLMVPSCFLGASSCFFDCDGLPKRDVIIALSILFSFFSLFSFRDFPKRGESCLPPLSWFEFSLVFSFVLLFLTVIISIGLTNNSLFLAASSLLSLCNALDSAHEPD